MASFDGWQHSGLATVVTTLPVALSTTRALVNIRVPLECRIVQVEADYDTIAGGAASGILTIWRDALGERIFFNAGTQTILIGTVVPATGRGGNSWVIGWDHLPDPTSPSVTVTGSAASTDIPSRLYADLRLAFALNVGTANLNRLAVTWRA